MRCSQQPSAAPVDSALSPLLASFPQPHGAPQSCEAPECLAHGRFCHEVTVVSPLVECVDRAGPTIEEETAKLSTFLC